MVKDLLYLLTCNHFLYKAVDAAKTLLLLDKILPVAAAVAADEQSHAGQEKDDNEREPPA